MLIAIRLVTIAVNVACDDQGRDLLVPESETECTPAFSRSTGGRLLLLNARASRIFLFRWDLAAGKCITQSQFGDVLNVSAERSSFLGTYELVKIMCNSLRSFFVFSIVKRWHREIITGSYQWGSTL